MRKRVLVCIAACFYYSGLVRLARWRARRSGQHVIILNYHRATGNLYSHLLYLRRHYRIWHLDKALEELYAPLNDTHLSTDLRTILVLTFDDGYSDNYTYGLPLASKVQVPFTVFLIPGYIASGARFWWLEGKYLVDSAKVDDILIEGRTYHLHQQHEREALIRMINDRLFHAPSVAERETFLATLRKQLSVFSSSQTEDETRIPLTWTEVQAMEESGWVSFGVHTMHHPILAYLSDSLEMRYEVGECRTLLERHVKQPLRTFAYPVGQLQHITPDVCQAVREANYNWAVTTLYGFNTPQSDPYLLRRIEVDANQHWLIVAAKAAGLWGVFTRLRWLPAIRRYLR